MLPNEPANPSDAHDRTDSGLVFPLGDHGELLSTGLTKRELFAGLAMAGLLASERPDTSQNPQSLINSAIVKADCLIQALDKATG